MAWIFGVTAVLAVAGYQLVPDDPWWTASWQVGIGYAAGATVLAGARRLPRRDRLPWWAFAAGVFSNATGIGVAAYVAGFGEADLPTPSDPFFLGLYPAWALGLALLIRRREPWRNWTAVLDATTLTVGLGLLAWVYVIAPAAGDESMSRWAHATQVAYPIGDLLLLALVTRLLRAGATRGPVFWWISASLAAFLIGDTAWVVLGHLGETGVRLEELLWFRRCLDSVFLTAFALIGIGALHGGARAVITPAGPRPVRLGAAQLTLLTATSLVAPALLAVQVAAGQVTDGYAIALGSTVLFLLVVARMAGLIREVERQARQVRELARRDELTGLPNRRAWNDELPRALEQARRSGAPVTVALLDLDRFKAFNDAYGHPAGDRLLKSAAAAWHETLRSVDVLARYGGEEFIVLLPDADVGQARQVLSRALAATPSSQTFSAGLAVWDGSETSDELIERADTALYSAKAGGRDRIEAALV
jgi:diguanylate cyclase (GGDEF)-like protein